MVSEVASAKPTARPSKRASVRPPLNVSNKMPAANTITPAQPSWSQRLASQSVASAAVSSGAVPRAIG